MAGNGFAESGARFRHASTPGQFHDQRTIQGMSAFACQPVLYDRNWTEKTGVQANSFGIRNPAGSVFRAQ
jgi:hypothetical protein